MQSAAAPTPGRITCEAARTLLGIGRELGGHAQSIDGVAKRGDIGTATVDDRELH